MAKKKSPKASYDDLLQEYKLLTMRADKRLQRLEKYAKRPDMGGLLKGAYARAMEDIEYWSGHGRKRFGTKAPKSITALQAKLNDIKEFLRSDTSTLMPGKDTQGYAVSSYKKAAKTFNARYGSDLTWQEIKNFYGSKKAAKIAASIKASKGVARALGKFKELHRKDPKLSGAELKRRIAADPNIKLDDDAVTNDIMKRMIKMGISPRTLFKG